jgi:hypothetical protein
VSCVLLWQNPPNIASIVLLIIAQHNDRICSAISSHLGHSVSRRTISCYRRRVSVHGPRLASIQGRGTRSEKRVRRRRSLVRSSRMKMNNSVAWRGGTRLEVAIADLSQFTTIPIAPEAAARCLSNWQTAQAARCTKRQTASRSSERRRCIADG